MKCPWCFKHNCKFHPAYDKVYLVKELLQPLPWDLQHLILKYWISPSMPGFEGLQQGIVGLSNRMKWPYHSYWIECKLKNIAWETGRKKRVINFGVYQDKTAYEIPIDYLYWLTRVPEVFQKLSPNFIDDLKKIITINNGTT